MTSTDETEARRKVRLSPEVRREQIIRQATRLISGSGFNAVSLADVGEACGIRKQSVLHYFPSMNQLLLAVLEHRDAQDFVTAGEEPMPEPTPAAARQYFTRIFERNINQREIIRLYYILGAEALSPTHPAHDYFTQRSRQATAELEMALAWKADPGVAAVELLAFWQGLEIEWLRNPDLDPLAVWAAFCHRFFA
ncbi:AcrR family transcriptional regulator [Actinoplanes lutulentus]|uniref:TetR family transcriptional regulator n=1 Tax=Actinoplanes lutulentus TaxID=1287878 RepID=A0A327Z1X3_9ACTN|nr:helix-turn-helix domain-containing protein [Actinoplanes lutulentus]MBB2943387.1 AcrR family transcriptional regulator [Actinoplanes lutulentus]RAK28445.1 TetR family transcriptional regulator [Actinoplanes lutulentus]